MFVFCILKFCLFQFVTLIPDQPGGWLLFPGPGSLDSSFELGWSFFNNRLPLRDFGLLIFIFRFNIVSIILKEQFYYLKQTTTNKKLEPNHRPQDPDEEQRKIVSSHKCFLCSFPSVYWAGTHFL